MVIKLDLQNFYLQNSDKEFLDLPVNMIEDIVYRSINIDYVITDRIKQNLLDDTKNCIIVEKCDFHTPIEKFISMISFYISPRGGILIQDGAIEGTLLNKNTSKLISSRYIKYDDYDYIKIFECIINKLGTQNIVAFIEEDKIVIDLNQFRNCKK